jgi:hypothetical protein
MRWAAGVGAAMIVIAAASNPAMAGDTSSARARNYLTLDDSVPPGYNPIILPTDPTQFVGYPEDAATTLGLDLGNAGCPGEASAGFTAG